MRLSALGLVLLIATASRLVAGDDLAAVAPGLGVAPDRGLGPGMAPWRAAPPEAHGLSATDLSRAANLLEGVPHRDCLLVIKDGELVHEAYYGDARRDARLATDNVGLLAVVALVGAAENQGLVHLDVPIADHGVDVSDVFGPEHGPDITLRHLLAQTHGGGEVSPGTVFRRDDSPAYLDVIARLLENASGRPFPAFARLALGEKIGAPNLFDGTTIPGDASGDEDGGRRPPDIAAGRSNAAGYLRATCGEMAKVAQLFLNDGAWPDRDGVPRQILSARFVRETFTPAFPQLNQAHGLAAWLHGPVDARGAACCRPVAGMTACGESAKPLDGPILGPVEDEENRNAKPSRRSSYAKPSAAKQTGMAPGPRERVALALGNDGSAIFIAPQSNVAAVTLGRTVAGSAACPLSAEDVAASALGVGSARRDDAALVRVFWDALEPALRLDGEAPTVGGGYAAAAAKGAAAKGAHDEGAHDEGAHGEGEHRARGAPKGDGSDAVRDMVTEAFERSFEARIGKRGGGGGDSASGGGGDSASGDASSGGAPDISGSFRGPPRAADAEYRRLAERQSKWYAEREMKMSEEQRRREEQFDESMEALKHTQAKYQRAYEMAKREIAAAAAEEKRAEAHERGAQTLATAARWQSHQLAASQKTQQAALDERQRALDAKYDEVANAQKEYKDALAAARRAREAAEAYRDELRGVSDRETEDRVLARDDVDEHKSRGERRAEARRRDAARGEETSRELAARADDALETRDERTPRRKKRAKEEKEEREEEEVKTEEEEVKTGEEEEWSGTDWSGETNAVEMSSSSSSASVGGLDVGALDFASKRKTSEKSDATPRRTKSSKRKAQAQAPKARASSSSSSSSSSSFPLPLLLRRRRRLRRTGTFARLCRHPGTRWRRRTIFSPSSPLRRALARARDSAPFEPSTRVWTKSTTTRMGTGTGTGPKPRTRTGRSVVPAPPTAFSRSGP